MSPAKKNILMLRFPFFFLFLVFFLPKQSLNRLTETVKSRERNCCKFHWFVYLLKNVVPGEKPRQISKQSNLFIYCPFCDLKTFREMLLLDPWPIVNYRTHFLSNHMLYIVYIPMYHATVIWQWVRGYIPSTIRNINKYIPFNSRMLNIFV